MKKPIVYLDMDGVLVDFTSALTKVSPEMLRSLWVSMTTFRVFLH